MRISREILHAEQVVLKRNAYSSRITTHGKCRNAYFSRNMTRGAGDFEARCVFLENFGTRNKQECVFLEKYSFQKMHFYVEICISREIRYMEHAGMRISREIWHLEWLSMVQNGSEWLRMA